MFRGPNRTRCAGTVTPVSPEQPPRLAGTATPLRRNSHPVAPEPPPRCAGTVTPSRRNRHPVAPEPPPRCAGTATPSRRNRHPVSPEPPPRCAGTVTPSRRNRHPVAPERPPRCAGTATPLRRNRRGCKNRANRPETGQIAQSLYGNRDKSPSVFGFRFHVITILPSRKQKDSFLSKNEEKRKALKRSICIP